MTEVTPNLPHCGNFCKYCFMGTLLWVNGIFFAYQTGKSGSEVVSLLPQIIEFQDDTNYVAIGGVTPENIPEFRKAGCLGVGLASSLMPKDKAAARDWDACAEYVHMLLTKAKGE